MAGSFQVLGASAPANRWQKPATPVMAEVSALENGMLTWFEIKRHAIGINVDRKQSGLTADQMLEQVRSLITQNGYKFIDPTPTRTGGHEFRTKENLILEYDP